MISSAHAIAIGYHGCERAVGEAILSGRESIRSSENSYDWLGHGAYFWESNRTRAWEWANGHAKVPFVVGSVISLGRCLDLTSGDSLEVLKASHALMVDDLKAKGKPVPTNRRQAESGEWLLRDLDCAVIEFLHKAREADNQLPYTTVRGVFFEGGELYPGAGFREHNHIQICVRDRESILGCFLPR